MTGLAMRYAPALVMAVAAVLAPLVSDIAPAVVLLVLAVALLAHVYRKCAEWDRCHHCHLPARERERNRAR